MPRRPGITFETVTPSPPDTLPRMDIAAFVGFATRGPIDVPVPVEDVARFRDVFGPPLELVRDRESGRTKTAHLHRAVEAFFRNGGRRCWVVRVAQPADEAAAAGPVERTSFGLPGLVSAETGRPSTMRARCYGATFDEMQVGTILRRRVLPDPSAVERAGDDAPAGALVLSWDATHRDPLEENQLTQGDLVHLRFETQVLWVSVDCSGGLHDGGQTLLKLEVEFKSGEKSVPLRFNTFQMFDEDGDVIPTAQTRNGDDSEEVLVSVHEESDDEGALRIEISVEGDFTGEKVTSYKFSVPFNASEVEITEVSTEETRTPDSAEITSQTMGQWISGFAPVASQTRVAAERNSDPNPSSLEVQTAPARLFRRDPIPLRKPIATGATETDDGSEVDVSVEVQAPSGATELPPDNAKIRRTASGDGRPLFHLLVGEDSGQVAAGLENRIVHISGLEGTLEGWLQLGRAARPVAEEKAGVEVRDTLWPVAVGDQRGEQTEIDRVFGKAPLSPVPTLERQGFDLLAWEGQELQIRLDKLGFATSHPRAWTDLPVDDDLFELQEGEAAPPESGTLRADVFDPRFPLASPASPGAGPFIPFGMADRPDPNRTRGRIPRTAEHSRLERERLPTFSADVFVDGTFGKDDSNDGLADTPTANLGKEADDKIYIDQEPASGLHSLWPIREATLLAVPDAVHRGWDEPQTVNPDYFCPPSDLQLRVDRATDPSRVHLKWTVDRLDDENVEVEVQEAQEPTFENPVVRYRGSEASVDRYVRSDDPVTLFFRYRVVAAGQPGPWSNTRHATVPETDFDACAARPEVPNVSLYDQDGPNADHWLRWAPQQLSPSSGTGEIDLNVASLEELVTLPGVDERTAGRIIEHRAARDEPITNPLQLSEVRELTEQCIRTWEGRVEPPLRPDYEIQIATTPTFEAPRVVVGCAGKDCAEENEEKVEFQVSPPPPGTDSSSDQKEFVWYDLGSDPSLPAVRYVRMRALRPGASQMNSSGWSKTVVVTRKLREERTVISTEGYENPQQDTPGRGRQELYHVHRAMLRFGAARGDVFSVLALPEQDQPDDAHRHVNRLRTPGAVLNYDEERTLSYGALYYPWLLGPVDDGGRITPMPPDGAACGMIADRTVRDGAWMAPANQSLALVRTVVPPLSSDERADLESSPINAFTETPDGVLTLGTATLARDPGLEPITTRRLLILVRRLAQREGPALVFENNTPLLRRRIAEQFDDVLRRLFDRGAFAGATPSEGYRVVVDESVNPPRQVERGRLVVELRVAPARPLKFLTVRLVQRSGQQPAVSEPGTGAAA